MTPGNRIFYAEREGNYYLRFVGDVRVTLCAALNTYIELLFSASRIRSVVVDLRQASAVDSTTLGLLAKLAFYVNREAGISPLLIVTDASMVRLVESMGLDEIFAIDGELPVTPEKVKEMPLIPLDDEEARERVIEAHRILMSMNNRNMAAFSDLVKRLEDERRKGASWRK